AEAKRRFAELIDRVMAGEQFVVSRRGRPALALVPADRQPPAPSIPPIGLAAVAGALADWDELDEVVDEIYAARGPGPARGVRALGWGVLLQHRRGERGNEAPPAARAHPPPRRGPTCRAVHHQ